jgi:hypothetical protein
MPDTQDADSVIRWIVYVVVAVVAAFAFIVSYTHIYDLGRANGQHGIAAKGTPLSVDLLIVAATLVLVLQSRAGVKLTGTAWWLPRALLWSGIAATVAANVAYGLPFGPVGAVVSAWPGAVFAGLAEMVMVTVRPVSGEAINQTLSFPGQPVVAASAFEAAQTAFAASVIAANPLKETQLAARFGIPRSQARKICAPAAPSMNGSGPHA